MDTNRVWKLIAAFTLAPPMILSAQNCTNGIRVTGAITDPTGAVIPGAWVKAASGDRTTSDETGNYTLPCVRTSSTLITVEADGFAQGRYQAQGRLGSTVRADLKLALASVQTEVQAQEDATTTDAGHGMGTITLNAEQVQQLPDDPDDLLRELGALASISGGDPTSVMIRVDGYQNGSALPPRSSIASIRVSPDLFSAEYQFPPFNGAQVEITTKPGADAFHGALFFTDSNSVFNANDAFSVSATPAGKRRYGFELTGPLVRKKGSFALALEKRDIDEFNVVNAVTLDANDQPAAIQQTVASPQKLWIASARSDWQMTPRDVAVLSFSSNVNNLSNQGIGGLALADSGYASLVSEYDLRLSNTQTLSANALHESRIGYTWKRTAQTPVSTRPSLQVAGYFAAGGATSGNLNNREHDLEIDDDLILTQGRHELKMGAQSLGLFLHNYDPDTFNGAYMFGGGSAPVLDGNNNSTAPTETITPIEQYRRALLGLPGGVPTTYTVTTGTPLVPTTQWRLGLYLQDDIKLMPRFTVSTGLRYALQTSPGSFINFGPRAGFGWSVDKKEAWVIHLRAGLFSWPVSVTDAYRLNGIRQKQTTIYSPNYENPLTPVAGSVQVATVNQIPASSLAQTSSVGLDLTMDHSFPHHWNAQAGIYWGEDYNRLRTLNINAPMVATSIRVPPDPTSALLAPRPIAPNENIIQYQNSSHLAGDATWFTLNQHSYKRFGFTAWYAHRHFKSDGGIGVNSPQSSYSDQGESARADWLSPHIAGVVGNLVLPLRWELAEEFDVASGHPYNITTGTDNNGDGDFNDRPAYAAASGQGVYSTRFGLLTINAVNGNVPRNLGTMPSTMHLDLNLHRSFVLNPDNKDRPRNLDFHARSANLMNHTNVTAVNTVLPSGALGEPVTAEPARRIELGVRLSF